jgi:hypothetical protein
MVEQVKSKKMLYTSAYPAAQIKNIQSTKNNLRVMGFR